MQYHHIRQVKVKPATEWWAFGCVGFDLYSADLPLAVFPSVAHKTSSDWVSRQLATRGPYSDWHKHLLKGYFESEPCNRTSGDSTLKLFQVRFPAERSHGSCFDDH